MPSPHLRLRPPRNVTTERRGMFPMEERQRAGNAPVASSSDLKPRRRGEAPDAAYGRERRERGDERR